MSSDITVEEVQKTIMRVKSNIIQGIRLSFGREIKCRFCGSAEVEEEKSEELTVKQTKALIKLARGLISAIEAEANSVNPKKIKEPRFVTHFKKTIMKHTPESVRAHENGQL